jgi:mannose/fructose/N-acetylgalactosamine-specific phosphotransferase system component IID
MLNGNNWFGPLNKTPLLGPLLFLTLFVVSAMICAMIALAYPFGLFWDKKNTKDALRIVFYTAAWLALFVIIILALLVIL